MRQETFSVGGARHRVGINSDFNQDIWGGTWNASQKVCFHRRIFDLFLPSHPIPVGQCMRISCLHMQAKPLTAGSLMIPAAGEVCNIIRTGSRRNPPALTKQRLILPRIHGSPMLVVKPQTSTPNASQTHESRNDGGCGKDFPPKAKYQGKLVQRFAWVPMVRSANVRPFMLVDRGIFSRTEIIIERNHNGKSALIGQKSRYSVVYLVKTLSFWAPRLP